MTSRNQMTDTVTNFMLEFKPSQEGVQEGIQDDAEELGLVDVVDVFLHGTVHF